MNKYNLALKITNWCNMNCAHCCERSASYHEPNIMPISTVRQHIYDFRCLNVPKFEHLVFTGGEAMAPYYHQMNSYIPECLDATFKYGFVPFIKTNGIWGNSHLADKILTDLAVSAYKNDKLVSLDISIDEFHSNLNQVVSLVKKIFCNPFLIPAIRISFVGLNTHRSKQNFYMLLGALQNCGISFTPIDNMTLLMKHGHGGAHVYYDFNIPVISVGRAADNELSSVPNTGMPDKLTGSCLEIDSDGNAILNYKWREKIAGQSLDTVLNKLLFQMNNEKTL